MLDTAKLRAKKRTSSQVLLRSTAAWGTWDVGTVRWWVDPGVEEQHSCPSTGCDRGCPSLGPAALEFSLLLPETVCTGLASSTGRF